MTILAYFAGTKAQRTMALEEEAHPYAVVKVFETKSFPLPRFRAVYAAPLIAGESAHHEKTEEIRKPDDDSWAYTEIQSISGRSSAIIGPSAEIGTDIHK